jgi:hypothetical protein
MIAAIKNFRRRLYAGAIADVDFDAFERRYLSKPIPVADIVAAFPPGYYRLRNGERVRVEKLGDDLVRAYGCSLPSALPLRWSEKGRYAPSGADHPLDLVEFEGER